MIDSLRSQYIVFLNGGEIVAARYTKRRDAVLKALEVALLHRDALVQVRVLRRGEWRGTILSIPLPVDVLVTDWSGWIPTSAWERDPRERDVDFRIEQRTRRVTRSPQWGGRVAPNLWEIRRVTRLAGPAGFPPVHCELSEWSAWMPIDNWSTCINGRQVRTEARVRTVTVPPENGGIACGPLYDTRMVGQACAPAVVGTPDGTRIPPAGELVTPKGDVYTLVGDQVHKNGAWWNGGTGPELLIYNGGLIYNRSTNGNWYLDVFTHWQNVGTDDPQNGPAPEPPVSGVRTKGRIDAGTNVLYVDDLLDFKVGDKVIGEIGQEPGKGKRGSRGVGGNWPSDAMGFPSLDAMKQRFGNNPPTVFCWINIEGPDFGRIYFGEPNGWILMSDLNWSSITGTGEYYNAMLVPRALQAEIAAIDVPMKRLTLHNGPTNGVARISVQGMNVYKDMGLEFTERLTRGDLTLPDGEFAVGTCIHVINAPGRVLEGQGQGRTRLFSPQGVPCLQIDFHGVPGGRLRKLTLQGNLRDNGLGLGFNDLWTPQWGYLRGDPGVDDHHCTGAGLTMGCRFSAGSDDAEFSELETIDLGQQHLSTQYSAPIWARDCVARYSDPIRQYMQWVYGWNDTQGGGCQRCYFDGQYITPGFEAFKSSNVLFEDCGGRHAMLAMNGSSFKLKNYHVTFDPGSLVEGGMGANRSQPLMNINTAIGVHHATEGGLLESVVLDQTGYVFQGNTSMIGFKAGEKNTSITVNGYENHAPPYVEGAPMHGAQAIDSSGPGLTVKAARLYGKAAWTEANQQSNRAVVFTLNAAGGAWTDVQCVDDPNSKFVW